MFKENIVQMKLMYVKSHVCVYVVKASLSATAILDEGTYDWTTQNGIEIHGPINHNLFFNT